MDEAVRLAYIYSQKIGEDEGSRAALLLTDGETKPLEFWVTGPVKTTELQRLLYGKVLERHILVELQALPLLGKIKEKPTIVLIKQTALLALQLKVAHPVLLTIRRSDNSEPAKPGQTLASDTPFPIDLEDASRIELRTLRGHEEAITTLRDSLKKVSSFADLVEPFDRIEAVLARIPTTKTGGK